MKTAHKPYISAFLDIIISYDSRVNTPFIFIKVTLMRVAIGLYLLYLYRFKFSKITFELMHSTLQL